MSMTLASIRAARAENSISNQDSDKKPTFSGGFKSASTVD